MMALNRYRLKHLSRQGHRGARRAMALLRRPQRLISLILLGNNLVNILAAVLATLLFTQLFGEFGPLVATVVLTVVILLFAEITPKTVAALHPELIAFPAARVLRVLMWLARPAIWLIDGFISTLLRLGGLRARAGDNDRLSQEELHTVVREAGSLISSHHQDMLLNVLELEQATVEDIMVPRSEIVMLHLEMQPDQLLETLAASRHTRLPVCAASRDDVVGVLHTRKLAPLLTEPAGTLDAEVLKQLCDEPYYIPERTSLHTQLINFQKGKERLGLVVDEYGMVQGLVTLEDILEEIVGEFTTSSQNYSRDVVHVEDGSYLVDGSVSLRELNRRLDWELPMGEARTLNGLIIEHLETLPTPGTSLRIDGYTLEITQIIGNTVRSVRIRRAPGATANEEGG